LDWPEEKLFGDETSVVMETPLEADEIVVVVQCSGELGWLRDDSCEAVLSSVVAFSAVGREGRANTYRLIDFGLIERSYKSCS
jgi:hypothetical protein